MQRNELADSAGREVVLVARTHLAPQHPALRATRSVISMDCGAGFIATHFRPRIFDTAHDCRAAFKTAKPPVSRNPAASPCPPYVPLADGSVRVSNRQRRPRTLPVRLGEHRTCAAAQKLSFSHVGRAASMSQAQP
jgi:hypothetical protein